VRKIPTIHRDGTFVYKGVKYRVGRGSDRPERDGSRFVERVDDLKVVAEGFGYLEEVRGWLLRAVREDWDDLDELSSVEDMYKVKHYGR
jgi:hypothetical protein